MIVKVLKQCDTPLEKFESEIDGKGVRGKNERKRQELYQDYISSKRCIVLTLEERQEPLKYRRYTRQTATCSRGSIEPQTKGQERPKQRKTCERIAKGLQTISHNGWMIQSPSDLDHSVRLV